MADNATLSRSFVNYTTELGVICAPPTCTATKGRPLASCTHNFLFQLDEQSTWEIFFFSLLLNDKVCIIDLGVHG